MRRCQHRIIALMMTALLSAGAFGAEAHVVQGKLRAKFSGKKITVKGLQGKQKRQKHRSFVGLRPSSG